VDTVLASLATTGRLLLLFLGPLALAALGLHAIERALATRLVSRFGWRGVLLTGWLGVPLHELSHAAACLLFRHRIEKLSLLAIDRTTGRLGEVQHAWERRSLYQQVGRFFIGVAPLAGGALVLWLLTLAFGPPDLKLSLGQAAADLPSTAREALHQAGRLLLLLLAPSQLALGLTWLYLYLCLCVSAHMSPSGSDLRGGLPGFLLLVVLLLALVLVVALAGVQGGAMERVALGVLSPLLALLVMALALGAVTLLMVLAVTALLPRRGGA
jgi:hypothetical protein